MGLKFLLTLAICMGGFFTVGANPDLTFPISKANATYECGGVLTKKSNLILYKVFEQVGNNERCVWIVATPNASSYNVRVSADFEFHDGFINVGALPRRFPMSYTYEFNSTWTTVEANILVITFQSLPNAFNRGFALEYEMSNTTSEYSPHSSHSFISLDTLFLKFPSGRDLYDNLELSTLVYPLADNAYRHGIMRYLVYKLITIDSGYWDFVEIYSFNSTANQFNSIGKVNEETDLLRFSSDDMMMVTFHSDHSLAYKGFYLSSVIDIGGCTK